MSAAADIRAYYPKRWKFVGLLLIGLGFVAIGLWMIFGDTSLFVKALGLVSVLFFGMCTLLPARRLIDGTPSLTFAPEGLYFGARVPNALYAHWPEITGMDIFAVKGQRMLGIEVTDREAVRARMPWFQRIAATGNAALGYPILNIAQNAVDAPLEEVMAEALRFAGTYGDAA